MFAGIERGFYAKVSRLGEQWLELDLHFLSLGGGEVALQWWFEECLVPYFNSEKLAAVKTIHIVTGYGKTRWRGARDGDDGMRKRIRAMLSFMNVHEFEQPNKGRIHIDKDRLEQEVHKNHGRIVFDQEGYIKFKIDQTTANQAPAVVQKVRPSNPPTRTGELRQRYNPDRDRGYRGRGRGGGRGGPGRGGPGRGFQQHAGRGGPGRYYDGPNREYQAGRQGGPGGQFEHPGRGYNRQQSDHYGYGPDNSGREGGYGNDHYSGGQDDGQGGYPRQQNDRYTGNGNSYGQQNYGSPADSRSSQYSSRDRAYGNNNQDQGSYNSQGGFTNDNDGYSGPPAASRGGYRGGNTQHYGSDGGHGHYGPGGDLGSSDAFPSQQAQAYYGTGGEDRKRPYDEYQQSNQASRGYDQGQYKRQARY